MWRKLGLIFTANGQYSWMQSHATVPTPLNLGGSIFKIFFSTRNELNQNQVGYVVVDLNRPNQILDLSSRPVIEIGEPGTFDCDGVYATSLVADGGKLRFYYAGWNAGLRGLFYSSIGMAESLDQGNKFIKHTGAPILSRDAIDSWAVMAPFVLRCPQGWMMWYASGIRLWRDEDGGLKSLYDIKTALSNDGISWSKTGRTAIALGDGDTNIARPSVRISADCYEAWYPFVSSELGQYRIGYARSADGLSFERQDDQTGITVSTSGWDSEAVTYPLVFEHEGSEYMLYNGNGFGKTGFGLAVRET